MVRHLLLDGYNLMHRARGGFKGTGDYPIVYNFFVSLRALVEMFSPENVTFVLEGSHELNTSTFVQYKSNRQPSNDLTRRQFEMIIKCLRYLPIKIAVHKNHEADDTIFNIIRDRDATKNEEYIVVSSDSDFTQLLQRCPEACKIWNWRFKKFVDKPSHDYVIWKSLAGDKTDNIPPVKQFAKQAVNIASSQEAFAAFLKEASGDVLKQFERNKTLISFYDFPINDITFDEPQVNYDALKQQFETMEFKSLIEELRWKKFIKTFEKLEDK
jgi:5'-3' exonuclease